MATTPYLQDSGTHYLIILSILVGATLFLAGWFGIISTLTFVGVTYFIWKEKKEKN